LLIVIAIIALLMGIIVPALLKVRQAGSRVTTEARIAMLSSAAQQYKQHNQYYPGQRELRDGYNGSLSWVKTGSQVLALSIFSPDDDASKFPADSRYCSQFEQDLLFTFEDGGTQYENTPSSGGDEDAPICYYPSDPRSRDQGAQKQYGKAFDWNKAYTGGTAAEFYAFITDGGGGNDTPRRSNEFLLIAPGPDGEYFTSDDIHNMN
jgi:type II secretory pathway pseudopilin PulG